MAKKEADPPDPAANGSHTQQYTAAPITVMSRTDEDLEPDAADIRRANRTTRNALDDAQARRNLTTYVNSTALFADLAI